MDSLLIYAVVAAFPLAFGALLLVSFLTPWPRRSRAYFLDKKFHYHPSGVFSEAFPNLLRSDTKEWTGPQHTQPSVYLSVIVPAMNEQDRLPVMLDECLEYLEGRVRQEKQFTYEVIVVDDGSRDRTADIAFDYSAKYPVHVLQLPKNVGKGGTVRNGVHCASGQFVLFADADGATKFADVEKLEREMRRLCNGEQDSKRKDVDWTHPAVVVGSRAHLEKDSIAQRSLFRTILMYGFHLAVYVFTVRTVRDTQCGFKMFSRAAAAKLFPQMHIERWAFDVELLYLAERLDIPVAEVAVAWQEIEGSKVTPFFSWIQMGRDILLIWFRYTFRIWRINDLVL
ncbi:dolichyl-phosphate beta-glucosyltransferase [Aphelenchoides avenae]|nr:dolichyl-phosphate beta-glucosyltransferase [Aphelenchus avenae]